MYDCWNEALEYLIKRCGERTVPNGSHYRGQKDTTKQVRTYRNDNVKDDDKIIVVLMGQYYAGIEAKKELYNILIDRGVIKEKVEL